MGYDIEKEKREAAMNQKWVIAVHALWIILIFLFRRLRVQD